MPPSSDNVSEPAHSACRGTVTIAARYERIAATFADEDLRIEAYTVLHREAPDGYWLFVLSLNV